MPGTRSKVGSDTCRDLRTLKERDGRMFYLGKDPGKQYLEDDNSNPESNGFCECHTIDVNG